MPGGLFVYALKSFCIEIAARGVNSEWELDFLETELFRVFCVSSYEAFVVSVRGAEAGGKEQTAKHEEEFMFCDGCGGAVQPGQAFCSKCGKQIVGPVSFMQPRPGRVKEHVRLLSLFWLALSAFNTIGGIALYVVANTVLVHKAAQEGGPPAFLTPLLSAVAILLLAKAAFGFIAGWGLLQHEHWARVVVLVLAFITLFTNIPFGTALGIYTMWVLLPAESEEEYEALVARAA